MSTKTPGSNEIIGRVYEEFVKRLQGKGIAAETAEALHTQLTAEKAPKAEELLDFYRRELQEDANIDSN